MAKTIAILATLDTKGAEAAFLKAHFAQRGFRPLLLDLGLLDEPAASPDISRDTVAEAANGSVPALLASSRDEAMERMGTGAGILLKELSDQGTLHGVIGLGGNQGTAMACRAMQALPLGLPKVMVSTVASGNMRPYIGAKDIATFFAVADLFGGPNPISRSILTQAAAALSGMLLWGEQLPAHAGTPLVAITALGNTHPAVARCLDLVAAEGWCGVTFHASGASGSAMEELIEAGTIDAVLDLTPHELVGEVLGHDIYTPVRSGRLTAAGRRGIPQVVSTGGLEYYCLGPKATIPPELQDRVITMHNPVNANVMLTADEMSRLGRAMADRLNTSTGPVSLMLPLKGWSEYGREEGPLWNPKGRAALAATLKASLRPHVALVELDVHINDPPFAEACIARLGTMLKGPGVPSR
ncbi:MAG: Tm-1-like ATP-binding domain-containing protein [Candidatus Methylomirabilales bacterium]